MTLADAAVLRLLGCLAQSSAERDALIWGWGAEEIDRFSAVHEGSRSWLTQITTAMCIGRFSKRFMCGFANMHGPWSCSMH